MHFFVERRNFVSKLAKKNISEQEPFSPIAKILFDFFSSNYLADSEKCCIFAAE